MSKVTASAAGGAMPATGLTQSRRGLLTALAAAPLISAVALPAVQANLGTPGHLGDRRRDVQAAKQASGCPRAN